MKSQLPELSPPRLKPLRVVHLTISQLIKQKNPIFYEHGSKTQFVPGKEVLEFIGFSMFYIW